MARTVDPDIPDSRSPIEAPSDLERLYRAMVSGDLSAAHALCAEDVVLHVPGRSQIAGSYRGPEGVASYFRSLNELSGGSAATTIDNFATAPSKAVVTQKVKASRADKELKDQQNVLLRIEGDRVVEAFVYPFDLRTHDGFWGRAPLFTPEDRDLIAEAIRRGSAPPPDPNAKRRVILWFALATVVFMVTLLSFNYLNSNYSAQRLFATTTDLSSVRHMVISDDRSGGSWDIERAVVGGASIEPGLGEVRVVLPIPRTECDELAGRLASTCRNSTLSFEPPFQIAWDDPARVTGGAGNASRLDLELEAAADVATPSRMTMVTSSESAPTLCFTDPGTREDLTLVDADGIETPLQVRPDQGPIACTQGLVLRIIGGGLADPNVGGSTHATSAVLTGVEELDFAAQGTFSDLDGLAGKLAFINLDTRVFDSAAHVISNTAPDEPLRASIGIGETGGRLTMRSDEATSIVTDEGELLPTQWERLPQPMLALFGSLVTALVLPALIAFLQLARDRVLLGRRHHT
jgi:ketosteroid isomerase-like protein